MGCSESGGFSERETGDFSDGVREPRVLRRRGGFGEKGGILGRARRMFRRKGTIFKGEWGV